MTPFNAGTLDRLAVSVLTVHLAQDRSDGDVAIVGDLMSDAQTMEHGLEGLAVALVHIAAAAIEELAAIGAMTNSLVRLAEATSPDVFAGVEVPTCRATAQAWLEELALRRESGG